MTGDPDLIAQYRQIHATSLYGHTSVKNLRFLRPEIRLLRPASIIDYGCGQSRLLDALDLDYPVELTRYDPAIPAYAEKPTKRADLLINVDVLEHINEADLDSVIGEMAALCRNAIVVIDTKQAAAILPDGRSAHVTVRPHAWWQARLSRFFPTLYPITIARRSRAGFRTWARTPGQTLAFAGMRLEENLRYFGRRALGALGGSR